ncbi:Hypothetical protein CINCED_3A021833 [Cinara cedri]|uniref:Uncharacterized protein n=1 Tax=Cinara cedri TaxID=506608 RepID=A0A5E4MNL7_9HEMI|nr:Hypothetical protein CINCED_3A021833 [Cinara cedri]
MLKEALKWVADHTGISWVLGKLSSGWKWLFSSKTDATENSVPKQSEPAKQHTEPLQTPVHGVDNFLEVKDKRLYLNLTKENFEECKNYHNSNSVFFNKEYGRNKFRMYIKHDEKELCIIGSPDSENCRIDIDLIIERNNSVNEGTEVRFSIHKAGNVQLSHGIGVTAISKKNDRGEYIHNGSILNMVETALQRKVAVKVSSEQSVAQTVAPEQPKKEQPTEQNNAPVVDQTTTPGQQPKVNEPVVNQTTTPEQPKAQGAGDHTLLPDICYFIDENDNLVLSMTSERYQELKGSTCLYIKSGEVEHRFTVTGDYIYYENSDNYSVPVTSIVKIENGVLYESQNIVEDVKKLLEPGKVIFIESISTTYSGKSLRVVQCPPQPQQNGGPEADTTSDSMTASTVSVYSDAQSTLGSTDASETLSFTDAQSTRDSEYDSDTTITNDSLSTTMKPSAGKDFFQAFALVNQRKEAEAPQANIIPCNVNRLIFDNNNLVFSIASTHLAMCKGYLNPANKAEHLLFIQCGKKEYRITGTLVGYNVTINSIVEMENGMEKGEILCPANDMESIKAKLGLLSSDWVIVDSVARYPTASQPQQNEESEEERFVVRRATAKEIAAGRAARAAALNGGFNSMTASTATVVEDLLSKTCGEKPDSLINQTTTKKEVVAGEKSL